jgi:NADH-quinone oxidoreductase subunit A
MNDYFPILVMIFLSAGFVVSALCVAVLLGPRKPSEIKDDPFECGTVGTGDANQRFSVKFYLVAMIFIVFDIEVVFMYPWAIQVHALGWYGFWVMLSFITVLGVGLGYIWRRGVLDW